MLVLSSVGAFDCCGAHCVLGCVSQEVFPLRGVCDDVAHVIGGARNAPDACLVSPARFCCRGRVPLSRPWSRWYTSCAGLFPPRVPVHVAAGIGFARVFPMFCGSMPGVRLHVWVVCVLATEPTPSGYYHCNRPRVNIFATCATLDLDQLVSS